MPELPVLADVAREFSLLNADVRKALEFAGVKSAGRMTEIEERIDELKEEFTRVQQSAARRGGDGMPMTKSWANRSFPMGARRCASSRLIRAVREG